MFCSELDEDHKKSKAKIEKDINDQVDLELAQEKLHLKERHYKVYSTIYNGRIVLGQLI